MRVVTVAVAMVAALCLMPVSSGAIAGADAPGPLAKLVDDAAQRLQTADPVAATKYLTGGSVDDPAREQQVLDSVGTLAATRHVEPGFVHDVFRDQIDATDSLEHSRFAGWKINPGQAPRSAPDLSSSRDEINQLNQSIVDDIAEQWNVLHATTCPGDLAQAKTAVSDQRHLDPLYRQALDYALHRYCH
ncbi:chorismate mutase [Mycobacterium sp. NPDC003449]